MRAIRRLFFVVLPLVFVALLAIFLGFATENRAAVTVTKGPTTADANRVNELAKRAVKELLDATAPTVLSVSEQELDSVFALMNRALGRLSGDAKVTPDGLAAAVTLALPKNPLRNYINLRFGLKPSASGIELSPVSIGTLKVPREIATAMLRYGLNIALGDQAGDQILASVTWVRFKKSAANIRVEPLTGLRTRLKSLAERLGEVRDDVALFGDPALIRIYYEKIAELEKLDLGSGKVSLGKFMTPLFQIARARGGDPAKENQAALLALAIYFGDKKFERFTGRVRTGALQGHKRKNRNVRLGGRDDLMLHFIVSAGLRLVGDHGVAKAIGEFKELLDSTGGGTGFSFVDLAADRTGLRFAEAATHTVGGARRLQKTMADSTSEGDFFPHFRNLPESMSDAAFKKRFGGFEDPRYLSMVRQIDRRIAAAHAYRKK